MASAGAAFPRFTYFGRIDEFFFSVEWGAFSFVEFIPTLDVVNAIAIH